MHGIESGLNQRVGARAHCMCRSAWNSTDLAVTWTKPCEHMHPINALLPPPPPTHTLSHTHFCTQTNKRTPSHLPFTRTRIDRRTCARTRTLPHAHASTHQEHPAGQWDLDGVPHIAAAGVEAEDDLQQGHENGLSDCVLVGKSCKGSGAGRFVSLLTAHGQLAIGHPGL